MSSVLLVLQLIVAIFLVAIILMQRSNGGALSGLGGGDIGGLLSARSKGNILTRITAVLATLFFVLSLAISIYFSRMEVQQVSVVDKVAATDAAVEKATEAATETSTTETDSTAPAEAAEVPTEAEPEVPTEAEPSVPTEAEPEVPTEAEAPAETAAPVATEAPAEPAEPAEPEVPVAE
ncbi:MAG: preprotein translocase subunit SecG [Alphaproteobacteria bacterium]|nr:preprotein translocase subunit SecG [Alphaproteobacteria bacterium]